MRLVKRVETVRAITTPITATAQRQPDDDPYMKPHIEERYDEWVTDMAHREHKRLAGLIPPPHIVKAGDKADIDLWHQQRRVIADQRQHEILDYFLVTNRLE